MVLDIQKTLEIMKNRLQELIPEDEMVVKAELVYEINKLKEEKNATILGHNYMESALYHFVADIKGDSLELCRKSAETTKDLIVFCGVRFMAESAKILNPEKKVLLPSLKAGCSLAASITAEDVKKLKALFPGSPVVTYVNTYADVKAEADICCTSGNAARVVESLDSDTVIFLPDEYLATNVARETGRKIVFGGSDPSELKEKNRKYLVGWHGRCEVHELFTVGDIIDIRKQYPGVVVLAHPECPPDVVAHSDFSQSTSAMIRYVRQANAPCFLILTECAMADNILAENPDKKILRLCSHRCQHMKEITLGDTLSSLIYERYEIDVPEPIRSKAKVSIDRMLKRCPSPFQTIKPFYGHFSPVNPPFTAQFKGIHIANNPLMRKPLIRDSFWPFHVTSRSNNMEWFYVPLPQVWAIFSDRLTQTVARYDVYLHAFVLMSNHFHLMLTTPHSNLDHAMRFLKTEVSRDLRHFSGRINHIFGGRYIWSWLQGSIASAYAFKYILRNPVRAGIVGKVEDYDFSTQKNHQIPLVEMTNVVWNQIPKNPELRLNWLNKPTPKELEELIPKALRRKEFRFSKEKGIRLKEAKLRHSYIQGV